ncbi:MAG: SNF2 helicase-associated domain-containing protein [Syntrophales bacterium]|nr:SNF2 helicase-associated domain-containing protein [Syntrophales bacterium]
MLGLLTPLQRAAEKSGLIRELVESGEIFHPLAWTPEETHRFLKDIPTFESSGVMIRIPDWWRTHGSRPARAQVKVTVGEKRLHGLGLDALLDFSVRLTMDGEEILPEEWQEILAGTSGLVLLKGKWVEIDREKLSELLGFWDRMKQEDFREGISFARGMRLLSGAGIEKQDASLALTGQREGMEVGAGKWLETTLRELRAPETIDRTDHGALLKTALRPYQQAGVNWLWFMYRLGLGGMSRRRHGSRKNDPDSRTSLGRGAKKTVNS